MPASQPRELTESNDGGAPMTDQPEDFQPTFTHLILAPDGSETEVDVPPIDPPVWADRPGGVWEYWDAWESDNHATRRWSWAVPPRNEAEIKAELAREMQQAASAKHAALIATLIPLATAIDKLDPDAMRDIEGWGINLGPLSAGATDKLERIQLASADIADAVKAVAVAVGAVTEANAASVEASAAVLDAVPTTVAAMALAPDPPVTE